MYDHAGAFLVFVVCGVLLAWGGIYGAIALRTVLRAAVAREDATYAPLRSSGMGDLRSADFNPAQGREHIAAMQARNTSTDWDAELRNLAGGER